MDGEEYDEAFGDVFREIAIFKYNLNHQEFITYIHDSRDNNVDKHVFDTTPRRMEA